MIIVLSRQTTCGAHVMPKIANGIGWCILTEIQIRRTLIGYYIDSYRYGEQSFAIIGITAIVIINTSKLGKPDF